MSLLTMLPWFLPRTNAPNEGFSYKCGRVPLSAYDGHLIVERDRLLIVDYSSQFPLASEDQTRSFK
jgi:hypothetical protein